MNTKRWVVWLGMALIGLAALCLPVLFGDSTYGPWLGGTISVNSNSLVQFPASTGLTATNFARTNGLALLNDLQGSPGMAGLTVTNGATVGSLSVVTNLAAPAMTLGSGTVTNGFTVNGSLYGSGGSVLTGGAVIGGGLGVTGGFSSVGTNSLTGTLAVSGLSTLGGVTNTGNHGVAGNLVVAGNTTVAGATNSGNAGVAGNFYVGGTATLPGTENLSGGDAQTQISARAVQPFRVTSSGLTITVGSGSVTDAAGTVYSWAGGNLTIWPSRTHYIYYDVQNGSLLALRNNYHQGGVVVATVVTGSSSVTSVTYPGTLAMRPSGLANFNRKTRQNIARTVVALGDSLTQGAGGSAAFGVDMVFSSANSSYGYNVPNISTLTYLNYGVGGTVANMGLAYMANIVTASGGAGLFPNQGVGHDFYSEVAGSPQNIVTVNAIKSKNPDLVVVCFGANASSITPELANIEILVRNLRRENIEVLLWNGNKSSSISLPCLDTHSYLADIAARYGAAFADIADIVETANLATNGSFSATTYASDGSGVHQLIAGQQLYAQGLRSIACDQVQDKLTTPLEPERLMIGISTSQRLYYPNTAEMIYTPRQNVPSTAAGTGNASPPSVSAGGKSSGSCVYNITVGSGVYQWDHHAVCAVDLVTEIPSNVTNKFQVYDGNGQLSGTSEITVVGTAAGIQVTPLITVTQMKALTPSIYSGSSWNGLGFGNFACKVICTSTNGATSANVEGVLVYTFHSKRVAWSDMAQNGAFAYEASSLDSSQWLYSTAPTANPSLYFSWQGNILQVLLHAGTGAGEINGWTDGAQTYSTKDLYNSGNTYVFNAVFAPGNASGSKPNAGGYGWHGTRLHLTTTVNGSAVADAAQNRRLGVYGAWALDCR